MNVRDLVDDVLDTLLPARCAGCGARGSTVCAACAATLTAAPHSPTPPGVSWWASCFAYEGVARELVARAKYRDERRLLRFVVPVLARAVENTTPGVIDIVTWAPASHARRRAHGVDHGELIARNLARVIGCSVRPCLERGRGTPQTGRDAATRRLGPPMHAIRSVRGANVLVVDDVTTTGGTLAAAARALRSAGANDVYAATLARTRRPGDASQPATYNPAHITVSISTGRAWTSSSSAST